MSESKTACNESKDQLEVGDLEVEREREDCIFGVELRLNLRSLVKRLSCIEKWLTAERALCYLSV